MKKTNRLLFSAILAITVLTFGFVFIGVRSKPELAIWFIASANCLIKLGGVVAFLTFLVAVVSLVVPSCRQTGILYPILALLASLAFMGGVFGIPVLMFRSQQTRLEVESHDDPATRLKKAQTLLKEPEMGLSISGKDARHAEDILLSGRQLPELTPEELSLLCKARNWIGDVRGQLKAAEQLWIKAPGTKDAFEWMDNSLRNNYIHTGGTRKIIAFADMCISNHYENLTDILVLKAEAVLEGRHGSNPEKEAETLLVQAYTLPNAVATQSRGLRSLLNSQLKCFRKKLSKAQQDAIIEKVNQCRLDPVIYGHYLPYKDIPMPAEVTRLVSAFSQAYASLDLNGVTNLFLPSADDEVGHRRQVFLEETGCRFRDYIMGGVTNPPYIFKPLCFDADNSAVLLDGMTPDSPNLPLEFRTQELLLTKTNGQWMILSLKPLMRTNVVYQLE